MVGSHNYYPNWWGHIDSEFYCTPRDAISRPIAFAHCGSWYDDKRLSSADWLCRPLIFVISTTDVGMPAPGEDVRARKRLLGPGWEKQRHCGLKDERDGNAYRQQRGPTPSGGRL